MTAAPVRKSPSAKKIIRFIERNLRHTEFPWAGKPFRLLEWQKQVCRDIFDDRDAETGMRRVRQFYLETGKGNGKSPFLAALGIAMMLCNGPGALVLSLAATYAQAKETTFDPARALIDASPSLRAFCVVKKRKIEGPNGCRWEVMTSDGTKGKAGYRPTCALMDELQEQSNRKLLSMVTANQVKMGMREPLLLVSGNAGVPGTVAAEWNERGMRYLAGDRGGDLARFAARIYGISPGDDWRDEGCWHKANPALGQIVTMEGLRAERDIALKNPAVERQFRQLHLGEWLGTSQTAFLDMEAFDLCTASVRHPFPDQSVLAEYRCWLGFDLTARQDTLAVSAVWVAPDRHLFARTWLWLPRPTAEKAEKDHEIPYEEWAKAGDITLTPGMHIDHTVMASVRQHILALAKSNKVQQVCYDRYRAWELVAALEEAKLICEPIPGNFEGMSQPTKELSTRIDARTITFDSSKALRWQAANVHVLANTAGDVRPQKHAAKGKYAGTPQLKIDGPVSIILAMARAIRYANSLVIETKKPTAQAVQFTIKR